MLVGLKRSLALVPLEPYDELPFRLTLYHACENLIYSLMIASEYFKQYGAYWIDALKDDVEALVKKEKEGSPKQARPLYEALEMALEEVERAPTLAFVELLDIGSLAFLPSVVNKKDLRKAVLGASLGLHVEKKHKKALRKALACMAAMSGAVLGER